MPVVVVAGGGVVVVAGGGVVVGAGGGVLVVVSSSSTTKSPSSSSVSSVSSSSKRGRLNCAKASCMIVPPYPRLAGNNKRIPKLMATIAALRVSPKKANWSVIITT